MANKLVVFPVGKQTEANAYRSWSNVQWAQRDGGDFSYIGNDNFGQWVVPYLGPPFEYPVGTPLPEPSGGEAMRADGVLVESVIWSED